MDRLIMQEARLRVEGLQVSYGTNLVIDYFDLSVANETIVLFGASGCGKTTILKSILGGAEEGMKVKGRISLDGQPIPKNQGIIGMVFQGPVLPTWITVKNLCRIGCNIRMLSQYEQEQKITEILERFEIDHLANHYPSQLSGGQKQRVALAITLLNQSKVLLLDEPTTFLDGMSKVEVWDFIEKIIRPVGIPLIIVSHDPVESLILGDKIYVLSNLAHITKVLEVPFPHPRSENIYHEPEFWTMRQQLTSRCSSHR
jgi:ABC-type nitrate/sulfonate/bicarbonate transport system ATPase subunit